MTLKPSACLRVGTLAPRVRVINACYLCYSLYVF
jgi:hypothetical protein